MFEPGVGGMSDFEGSFGLFGLMFGLIVAELALKFADAIDSCRERPIGTVTPARALLVLTDVTSFWVWIWALRNALKVNWHTVFGGVLLATVYFLAATLVFPRTDARTALSRGANPNSSLSRPCAARVRA